MEHAFRFSARDVNAALVILFPPGVKGLFNPEIHKLVREVEAKLDDVHVTYALSSGGSPDLGDAVAAARFAGCDAAVVVHPQEIMAGENPVGAPAGDSVVDWYSVASEMDANVVAETFLTIVKGEGKAA